MRYLYNLKTASRGEEIRGGSKKRCSPNLKMAINPQLAPSCSSSVAQKKEIDSLYVGLFYVSVSFRYAPTQWNRTQFMSLSLSHWEARTAIR